MNPVSFGSVYKVYRVASDLNKREDGHSVLQDYCLQNNIYGKSFFYPKPKPAKFLGKGEKLFQTTIISAPPELDHSIDMICNNYQIKHEKLTKYGSVLKTWNGKRCLYDEIKSFLNSIF